MNHHWQPIGHLHLPEPLTPEQELACETLIAWARVKGGLTKFHNGIKHEERT